MNKSLVSKDQTTLQSTDMAPPESAKGLWYNPLINRFEDDTGAVMNDLTALFSYWTLERWKRGKEYALLKDKTGELWELFYDSITPYRECQHYCNVCPSKCEIYELIKGEYTIL